MDNAACLYRDEGVSEYIEYYIVFSVFNVVIALLTTFSNGLVLVSIWRSPPLQTPSNALLFGLALSDLLVGCLAQPLFVKDLISAHIQTQTTLNYVFCHVYNTTGTILLTISFASVTFVGIDRLLALQLHLRYNALVTVKRIVISLISLWIASLCVIPLYFWAGSIYIAILGSGAGIILLVSAGIYSKIYKISKHHLNRVRAQEQAMAVNHSHNQERGSVEGMRQHKLAISTLYVYCLMVLCYLPLSICAMLFKITGIDPIRLLVQELALTVMYLNSLFNPLMYCWRIHGIRAAMKRTLVPCKK